MVGRLQTERDKARLLDGMSAAAGGVDVKAVGDTISGLAKREFVLRRAGKDTPEVFTTRWAMSYLRGPLTRDQIASLMADRRTARRRPLRLRPLLPRAAPAPTAAAPAAPAPDAAAAPPVAPAAAAPTPAAAPTGRRHPDDAGGRPGRRRVLGRRRGAVAGQRRRRRRAAPATRRRRGPGPPPLRRGEGRPGGRRGVRGRAPPAHRPRPTRSAAIAVDYDERDLLPAAPGPVSFVLPDAPIKQKTFWIVAREGPGRPARPLPDDRDLRQPPAQAVLAGRRDEGRLRRPLPGGRRRPRPTRRRPSSGTSTRPRSRACRTSCRPPQDRAQVLPGRGAGSSAGGAAVDRRQPPRQLPRRAAAQQQPGHGPAGRGGTPLPLGGRGRAASTRRRTRPDRSPPR